MATTKRLELRLRLRRRQGSRRIGAGVLLCKTLAVQQALPLAQTVLLWQQRAASRPCTPS